MVEVELKPGVSGCIMAPLGCLSLGLVPPLTRLTERHRVSVPLDDGGVMEPGYTFSETC